MYVRRRIYQQLKKMKRDDLKAEAIYSFYREVRAHKNTGVLLEHFRELISSIIENGVALPIPSIQINRRRQLGLPDVHFDDTEIRILMNRFEFTKTLRSEQQ